MSHRIYITRKIPDVGIKMLQDKGYEFDMYTENQVIPRAEMLNELKEKEYDALLTLLTENIDAEVFDTAPSVKMVSNYAVGFNNIDIAEANKRGIVVANTPGASTSAVAEFTVALILALTHKLIDADQFMRDGKYKGWDPYIFLGTELSGKTLGLIGAGRIGSEAARMLSHGLGMKIMYYDTRRNDVIEKECGAVFVSSIEELLPLSDVVSVHVPLLPTTHHLLNYDHFKLMKKTAILINTSRGPVIDEGALVTALREGLCAGAALDVYENEPHITEGLDALPNVILTPHIGSATDVARDTMAVMAAQNLIEFFEGEEVKNKVVVS